MPDDVEVLASVNHELFSGEIQHDRRTDQVVVRFTHDPRLDTRPCIHVVRDYRKFLAAVEEMMRLGELAMRSDRERFYDDEL